MADAYRFWRDAKDAGAIIPVHIGRLSTGGNFDAVPDPLRETGFRLNIGVLHEGGLKCAFDRNRGRGEPRLDIAFVEATLHEFIVGVRFVNPCGTFSCRLGEAADRDFSHPLDWKCVEINSVDCLTRAN